MTDLSLHVDCTYRWDEARQFIASPNVRTVFLLNPTAEQVQYALGHCDLVIVRLYDIFNERNALGEDFEKSIVNRKVGASFVQWLDNSEFSQFKHNKKVRLVLSWNELYSKRGQAERVQNANVVEIGQAMVNAGYGVGLGGWASDKSFYADDVNNGHWDSVINFAIDNIDMVSIDCHEYDVLSIFTGHLKSYPDGFPDTLKTKIALDPNNHATIPYTRAQGNIETNYKIGRIALLIQRALDIRGTVFKWYRGECALDFKDDGALKPFIDNWYKPQFGQPTGINSLIGYYRHLLGNDFTDKQYDELIFRQYTDLASQDPDSCQGNFIFAWNGDRNRWLPFDVAQRPYFVSLIASHNDHDNTQPIPEPEPEPVPEPFDPPLVTRLVSTSTGYLNVRKEPTAKSAELNFDITPEKVLMQISLTTVTGSDGLSWHKLKYNGEIGYVAALEKLRIEPDPTPQPDPQPEPEPTPDDLHARVESLEVLVEVLTTQLMATISEVDDLLHEQRKAMEAVTLDIPVGDITITVPRLMLGFIGSYYKGIGILNKEISDEARRANGELLAQDDDSDVFSTQTAAPDMSQYFSNVAHDDDDSLLNEMLNGGDAA